MFTAAKVFKYWLLMMLVSLIAGCGGGASEGGGNSSDVSNLVFSAPETTISAGSPITLTATATDASGDAVFGAYISFSLSAINGDEGAIEVQNSNTTNSSGQVKLTYTPPATLSSDIEVEIMASVSGIEQTVNITVSANDTSSNQLGSITLNPANTSITADGSSVVAIDLNTYYSDGTTTNLALGNIAVNLTTTQGLLSTSATDFTTATTSLSTTTDGTGVVRVYLQSSTTASTANITASSSGVNANTSVGFTSGAPVAANATITPAITSLPADGSSNTTVTVELRDANNNLVTDGTSVTLQTTAGSISSTNPLLTALGRASFTLLAPSAVATATLTVDGITGLTSSVSFTATANTPLNNMTLTPANTSITADGSSVVAIDLNTYYSDGTTTNLALGNIAVNLTTTQGLLSTSATDFTTATTSLSTTTDGTGVVRVYLQSSTTASTANITASSSGVNANTSVGFLPGVPDATKSSLTPSPSSLPADSTSTSTVTALLLDANSNLVADGTSVTLQTSAGTVTSTNPVTTVLGRAEFTLLAPSTASTASLSLLEYPTVTTNVTFGSTTSTDPANIDVSVSNQSLFVFGVGKQDTATFTISVRSADGNLIGDANAGINNLKVSLKTRPNAGEKIIGTDAAGTVVESTSANPEIAVRTASGVATFTIQSGTLPGTVELEIEALNPDGTSLATPLTALVPQISIASGPPDTINLSYPSASAVENLGNGVYRRVGTAFVTDRYGNAVPDATVISLGVLDSVIASNNANSGFDVNTNTANSDDASIIANSTTLTDNGNAIFDTASITRNDTARIIRTNDRLLLLDAQAGDKSRFVGSIGGNTLEANKDYLNTIDNLTYIVGASALGAQILGVNEQTDAVQVGQATTKNGYATFYLNYPADNEHIRTGCLSDPSLDTRATHAPAGSAQVWVVAESNETGATTIDNRACFSSILDWELIDSGVTDISSSTNLPFSVRDANEILLPFVSLGTTVAYTANTGGLSVSVGSCAGRSDTRTNTSGSCTLPITVAGGASGDSATVSISAGGNSSAVDVTVSIP